MSGVREDRAIRETDPGWVNRATLCLPDPLWLVAPRLGFRRRHRYLEVSQILSGEPHLSVVYFVRAGRNVKIGTTTNLRKRMLDLYVDLGDVLAVVPGDRRIETAYHDRFCYSRLPSDGRTEVFRLDRELWWFLVRCSCTRWEALQAFVAGWTAMVMTWCAAIAGGGRTLYFCAFPIAALIFFAVITFYCARLGWDWRSPATSWLAKRHLRICGCGSPTGMSERVAQREVRAGEMAAAWLNSRGL